MPSYKIDNGIDVVTTAVKEACTQRVEPDGMAFDVESIAAKTITKDAGCEEVHVRTQGNNVFISSVIRDKFLLRICFPKVGTCFVGIP